ncbi:MAG: rod shape-determining protein MreC [Holosporaceae bacterium]|jgi:rod shape-determining protein MreC|nr:rod shape-determining protein MreC [Holosporaceae bacterium]
MHKKIAGRKRSFTLFRRFRKREIIFRALFFCGTISVLHMKIGDRFIKKCRFFTNSAIITLNQCTDNIGGYFLNFYYFISHDINNILINLHNTNVELREEIEKLKNLRQENEELRALLSLKKLTNFSAIAAKVMCTFSNDFTQSFTLSAGKIDGVSTNDIIKNSEGLVGRVIEANDSWSRVLLITDMNSSIPVKIGESQINAIMTGSNSDKLFISSIREDIPIKEGDVVKTSGYGICEDVFVGKIVKSNKKFMIKSPVNFSTLKYVVVLKKD